MTTPTLVARETAIWPSLADSLAAGLAWLDTTPQHPGAICNHHGESLAVGDGTRILQFVPRGADGLPVVVVKAFRPRGTGLMAPAAGPVVLEDGELAAFADMIRTAGYTVRKIWNGDGTDSGSVGLAKMPHPTLTDAVLRYHAGCPHHGGTVFCGGWQARNESEHWCRYFPDGYALLTYPTVDAAGTPTGKEAGR